jgi:hypothetical protein
MLQNSLTCLLAASALALSSTLVTAGAKSGSQKSTNGPPIARTHDAANPPQTSREVFSDKISDRPVRAGGTVLSGSSASRNGGTTIMKTKHDTVKNSISNVR